MPVCRELDWFGGEEVGIDGTFIRGNASKASIYTPERQATPERSRAPTPEESCLVGGTLVWYHKKRKGLAAFSNARLRKSPHGNELANAYLPSIASVF